MSTDRLPRIADSHDPFWPRVDLGRLHERLKLQQPVSDAALEVAARCAVIAAASEFARWRAALRERGYQRSRTWPGMTMGAPCTCVTPVLSKPRSCIPWVPRLALQDRDEG